MMYQTVIQAVAETFTPISGIMLSPIPLAGLIVVLAIIFFIMGFHLLEKAVQI